MNELEILLPGNWPALRRRLAEVEPPPVALDQEAWGMPYSWHEESPGASDCEKAEQIDFKCRTQASLLQLRRIRRTKGGRFVNRPYGPRAADRCGHRPLRVPSAVWDMAVRTAFHALN